jgi:tRNA pseudouridine55 synthase
MSKDLSAHPHSIPTTAIRRPLLPDFSQEVKFTKRIDISKLDQVLLIDKPKGWSSFDVIRKLKQILPTKKIGHAGTLDPLATGLLIVCSGKMTKQIAKFQEWDKEYLVEFCLGATTKTYDSEFEPENLTDARHISQTDLESAMAKLVGQIEQCPPAFSAVKIGGKRAYTLARAGQEVQTKSRQVQIFRFDLLDYSGPESVKAAVICSKGTYIRTLVHDLGQSLGVGAYIKELRRTRIGQFRLSWDQSCSHLLIIGSIDDQINLGSATPFVN